MWHSTCCAITSEWVWRAATIYGMANSAGQHWHKWGKENPFYGVLSHPKFLNANLNEQSREEFFQSGERHVNHVYHVIQTKLRDDFQPSRVLDFGCGVGRLLIPFARR